MRSAILITIYPKSARQLFLTSTVKTTGPANKARRRWLYVLAWRMISPPWQKLDDHCHRGQSTALEIGCMKEPTIDQPEDQHESTYALLMRSEEKSRNLLEMVIYPLLIIGAIIAIWQFVLQAVELPSRDTPSVQHVVSGQKLSVDSPSRITARRVVEC